MELTGGNPPVDGWPEERGKLIRLSARHLNARVIKGLCGKVGRSRKAQAMMTNRSANGVLATDSLKGDHACKPLPPRRCR